MVKMHIFGIVHKNIMINLCKKSIEIDANYWYIISMKWRNRLQFIERSTCDYAEFIGGLQENERNCKDIAEEKLQETTRINEKGVLCMPMKKTLRQLFTEEKVVEAQS